MSDQSRTKKQRLDLLLVERQLAESRERARRLIMAGEVLVDERVSDKPGKTVPVTATIRVRQSLPYVSRGGLKLKAALDAFALDVTGLTAVDVGASTGGFTDCLLQHGAACVYAVDVGYGQLAWSLRQDDRVVVMERTNIRHLEELPPANTMGHNLADGAAPVLADLATIDASFIGLELVLPPTLRLLQPAGEIVALIKPQFEAGPESVGRGGVVRDPRVHRRVLHDTLVYATGLDLVVGGLIASPAIGPAGNVEFLVRVLRPQHAAVDAVAHKNDLSGEYFTRLIDDALIAATALRKGKQDR